MILFVLQQCLKQSRDIFKHERSCVFNYHDQKIRQTFARDICKHWTAVSILLGLISSVYHDLPLWRSNQQPQNVELKLFHWAINPHCTHETSNQRVMVIVGPISLNVSCKFHLYSLQRTLSPPGPRLHKRIGNTPPCNYYNLKGKEIDVHFSFFFKWRNYIVNWITMSGKSGQHLCVTYENTGQLFRPY